MAITTKSQKEIELLREGGKRLAGILRKIAAECRSGVSTRELDRLAESLIFDAGGIPSFKGYKIQETKVPYPGSLCASINDEVVHTIPSETNVLKEGDIIGLDIGMWWPLRALPPGLEQADTNDIMKIYASKRARERPLATDTAITIGVGKISEEAQRLLQVTEEALNAGIKAAKPGSKVGDISYAIQTCLDKHGLGIVHELAGHGVGYKLHEEPLIPNYGKPGTGPELTEGMVIAIEPISTLGSEEIKLQKDEWTFKTKDGSLSAHFEHTLAIMPEGPEILTT